MRRERPDLFSVLCRPQENVKTRNSRVLPGLEVKKTPALSGGTLTQTMRTRQFLLPVREYVLASANSVRRVTVSCDVNHCLRRSILAGGAPRVPARPPNCWAGETPVPHRVHASLGGLSGRFTRAPAAGDAGYILSVYVQISDFVTKVLIRKRFRPSVPKRELTNLET
jgi:hypothetical protein